MTKYVWAQNARLRGDAQLIGKELNRLQRINGNQVTPKVVVEAARSEKSALHACFTWDNERAAELHRENEARAVIRSIRVIHDQGTGQTEPHRVFVNVSGLGDDDSQAYVTMAKVLSDPELFEKARQQFLADLHSFEKRYAEFEALVLPLHGVRAAVESMAKPAEMAATA